MDSDLHHVMIEYLSISFLVYRFEIGNSKNECINHWKYRKHHLRSRHTQNTRNYSKTAKLMPQLEKAAKSLSCLLYELRPYRELKVILVLPSTPM